MTIKFSWDENKAQSNYAKHNVSFEEAKSVFYDDKALLIDDPDHSEYEDRFIILGISRQSRILVVCHCYRDENKNIRIISARKATKKEQMEYSEGL